MEFDNHNDITKAEGSNTKDFISLLSLNQIRIYSYILSMVGNFSDTDDIVQETTLTMWQKFSRFEAGTDFLAWGIAVAHYKILEFRKRNRGSQISDELLEQLSSKAPDKLKDANLYIEKLEDCLKKLAPNDYSLINQRYMSGYTVTELAKRCNVTIQSIYLRLAKIQGLLTRCVRRSVMAEETI